jgi:hypothetical protein
MATRNTSTLMLTSSTILAFEHSREEPSSVYHVRILHIKRKNEKYNYQEKKKKNIGKQIKLRQNSMEP